jgi:hypothetical protein
MTSYVRSTSYVGLKPTWKADDLLVLNDDDVADLVRAAVKREGSQAAFAKRYGIDRRNAGDDEDQYQRERQLSDPKAYMRLWVRLRDVGHTRRSRVRVSVSAAHTSASEANARGYAPKISVKIIKPTCRSRKLRH